MGRNCPDHWRQFHRTTGSTYIPYDNTPADRTKASCYNCAAKGHWGHECTAPRPTPLLGPILEPFTTGRVSDSQSDLMKDDKIRREKRNKKRFLITIGWADILRIRIRWNSALVIEWFKDDLWWPISSVTTENRQSCPGPLNLEAIFNFQVVALSMRIRYNSPVLGIIKTNPFRAVNRI